jgi:hypothetical protein
MNSTREQVLANIKEMKKVGWVNTPPPVQTENGNWVLQEVRVVTYDLGKNNFDRCFPSEEMALDTLRKRNSTVFNLYRTPGGGAHWRTDW